MAGRRPGASSTSDGPSTMADASSRPAALNLRAARTPPAMPAPEPFGKHAVSQRERGSHSDSELSDLALCDSASIDSAPSNLALKRLGTNRLGTKRPGTDQPGTQGMGAHDEPRKWRR